MLRTVQTDTLHFESLPSFFSGRQPLSPRAWTFVGALAIPLWATWPALAVRTAEMPAFQVLAIAFSVAWLVLLASEHFAGDRAATPGPDRRWLLPVLACAFGLCGA